MTPERWKEVRRVFEEARLLDARSRRPYLEERCAEDAELLAEVRSLLEADVEAGGFLEAPLLAEPSEPEQLGPWRLLRELGRGGMGTVWLAERSDGYRQQAALKLLKRGLDTDELVRRFRAERQILAQLVHPAIARLLDGGSTPDGRPYIVMEYVEGQPIDRYCEQQALELPERLRLFLRVCAAVRFAHQRLVVHRDIKPGNVLVGAEGQPKLLDFGIAKLLLARPEDETAVATLLGRQPLTPEYASPEQLRGELATTASDVYSLGVVLYELLTAERPYRLEVGSDPLALARVVEQEAPARPSSRVGAQAARARALRGDLDTIVLKALHRDPQRRYSSVEELSEDLERHLAGLPVRARPDTLGYRLGKFLGRNRALVGAGLLAAGLLAGFVFTLIAERRATERQQRRAEVVSKFLEELFALPDPSRSRGENVTARQLLTRGAERIQLELGAQPDVQAELMETMGRSLRGLGLYAESRPLLEQALELERRAHGPVHAAVARTLQQLAELELLEGRYGRAAERAGEALELRRRVSARPDELTESASRQAQALALDGQSELAETRFREALALAQGATPETRALLLDRYANLLSERGRDGEARPLLKQALELYQRARGERHPDVALTLNDLGQLEARHDPALAERLLRRAEATQRGLFHEPHPHLATTLNNLGLLLQEQGRLEQAEPLYAEALSLARSVYQGDHPKLASTLVNVARLRQAQGRYAQAEAGYREALAMQERVLGAEHPEIANTWNNLGETLATLGRSSEAEAFYTRALSVLQARPGAAGRLLAVVRNNLGDAAQTRGDLASAERHYVAALDGLRAALGREHPDVAVALYNLATLREAKGDLPQAEAGYREALAMVEARLGPGHTRVALLRLGLAALLVRRGRPAEAEPLARRALDALAATLPASDPARLAAERVLASSRAARPAGAGS